MQTTMIDRINNDTDLVIADEQATPVLATPAAFVAGVVAGGKAAGALVTAAGVGAAVGKAAGGS